MASIFIVKCMREHGPDIRHIDSYEQTQADIGYRDRIYNYIYDKMG